VAVNNSELMRRFYPEANISGFSHDPDWFAGELLRVVKPGGLIAAITPNKFGYIGVAARIVPNKLHVGALRKVQPFRKEEDIFPTRYRLNNLRALRKAFGDNADVFVVRASQDPRITLVRRSFSRR
jgi:hypothetical protein